MLVDKGFCLPSVEAQRARKTAESLIVCVFQADNEFLLNHNLSQNSRDASMSPEVVRVRREKMWENLFLLCSSPDLS